MPLDIRDPATGKISSWVWIAGGAAVIFGLITLMKGSSSSTQGGVQSAGQSSGISDQLGQVSDAIANLAGNMPSSNSQGSTPTPQPAPNPNPTPTPSPTPSPNPAPSPSPSPTPQPLQEWLKFIWQRMNVALPAPNVTGAATAMPGNVPNSVGFAYATNPTNPSSDVGTALNTYIAGITSTGGGGDSTQGNLSSYVQSPNDQQIISAYQRFTAMPTQIQAVIKPGIDQNQPAVQLPPYGLASLFSGKYGFPRPSDSRLLETVNKSPTTSTPTPTS